jgi:4'-phosphopantetheinyl transferase
VSSDVESLGRPAPIEVAERFFAPAEVRALHSLPSDERTQRFFDYWTLKESYIKARGLGLAIPLDRFGFALEPSRRPRLEVDGRVADSGDAWLFDLIATCVRRSGPADLCQTTSGTDPLTTLKVTPSFVQ